MAVGRVFKTARLAAAAPVGFFAHDRVKMEVTKLWASAVASPTASNDVLTAKARDFQDEIFERRRTSPLVFDWVYNLLKDRFEDQMNRAASDLVDEVKEKERSAVRAFRMSPEAGLSAAGSLSE